MKTHIYHTCNCIRPNRLADIRGETYPAASLIHAIIVLLFALTFIIVTDVSGASSDTAIDERYDENTEITVKGTVLEVVKTRPRGMGRGGGPVILLVRTKNKSFHVVTAPAWYLERQGVAFREGAVMEVRGSRYFSDEGTVYLIAREIRDPESSKTVFLRDSTCRAMWHGQRMMNRQRLGQ